MRLVGLVGAPAAALLVHALLPHAYEGAGGEPMVFGEAGRRTLAVMVWMAGWWMTEAIDVAATALVPVAAFPLLGLADVEAAAAPYASPLVFLFLGGFLLATGMARHGLDRRIALLTLRAAGDRPAHLVGAFMVATAALSSCVSNTATAAMMLPVGVGVARLVAARVPPREAERFELALMLGIAYAASIGGMATLIGSPPNGFLAQFAARALDLELTFVHWLAVGLPVTCALLPATWWLLTRWLHPLARDPIPGGRAWIRAEHRALGPPSRGERAMFTVFVATVLAWIGRPLVERVLPGVDDAGIAIVAGLALFVIPLERGPRFALSWEDAQRLPWGVLVLFGGGLSLADAVAAHGVDEFLGAQAGHLAGLPAPLLVAGVTAGVVFLTELTSNTASAATLVPILAATAPALGAEPVQLATAATLAASCAFMLPVATPPNAIVFASGRVTVADMARAGLWLNLVATLVVTGVVLLVLPRLAPG